MNNGPMVGYIAPLPDTLGEIDTDIFAAFFTCQGCGRRGTLVLADARDRFGTAARIRDLERRARCRCGHRGAILATERTGWR
jgi:hypothetical protein